MEEIAAWGIAAGATDVEYSEIQEVAPKPAEAAPERRLDIATQVLTQYRQAPVQNDQWLRSLARTENAEIYWHSNDFFVCVFPDLSYVSYNFEPAVPEFKLGRSTFTPEEFAAVRAGNGFRRVYG